MELKKGMQGSNVADIQRKLNSLGFSVGSADGIFGPMTESAVKRFQEANKIMVTGIVDYETLKKINEKTSPSREVASSESFIDKIAKIKNSKLFLVGIALSLGGLGYYVYKKTVK